MQRFEQAIQEWYDKSKTADLSYLDLETKPSLAQLSNNTLVVYDRLNLLSRVHLKHDHEVQLRLKDQGNQIEKILADQRKILKAITSLQVEVVNLKPLTISQVRKLVEELIKEPKEIERKTEELLLSTQTQVRKIEEITTKILNDLT